MCHGSRRVGLTHYLQSCALGNPMHLCVWCWYWLAGGVYSCMHVVANSQEKARELCSRDAIVNCHLYCFLRSRVSIVAREGHSSKFEPILEFE